MLWCTCLGFDLYSNQGWATDFWGMYVCIWREVRTLGLDDGSKVFDPGYQSFCKKILFWIQIWGLWIQTSFVFGSSDWDSDRFSSRQSNLASVGAQALWGIQEENHNLLQPILLSSATLSAERDCYNGASSTDGYSWCYLYLMQTDKIKVLGRHTRGPLACEGLSECLPSAMASSLWLVNTCQGNAKRECWLVIHARWNGRARIDKVLAAEERQAGRKDKKEHPDIPSYIWQNIQLLLLSPARFGRCNMNACLTLGEIETYNSIVARFRLPLLFVHSSSRREPNSFLS